MGDEIRQIEYCRAQMMENTENKDKKSKDKWILPVTMIAILVITSIFSACVVIALILGNLNIGSKYTREDAMKLADRVSKDNTYLMGGDKQQQWYFQDNEYKFCFIVKTEKTYPPGLPPTNILMTDYYCRRFEDKMALDDNVMVFEMKSDDRYTPFGDVTTPAEYKSGQYECICFSDEDIIRSVNAINKAVMDICQEDQIDGLLHDNYKSITIIYKLDDKAYVDLLHKGNTIPEDVIDYFHK